MENMSVLDELIVGRVNPSIYAFSTNMIPSYLKVGDTYRAVSTRLNEWRRFYPDLQQVYEAPASVSEGAYFRDYAVHSYLMNSLGRKRLLPNDMDRFPPGTHYSSEFFKETTVEDVEDAIDSIRISYDAAENRYQYYDSESTLPAVFSYASTGYWEPRPNQKVVIENFKKAVENGRTNLLMYAVMRFGKTFTALCCAKSINAAVVLVVSAKADVKHEWKKAVQSADNFNSDYQFFESEDLARREDALTSALKAGNKAVVFLTLQDLQGKELKEKHREIFTTGIDLLIIDETHFGARSAEYGEVLRNAKAPADITVEYDADDGDDYVEGSEAMEQLKQLSVAVKLHLSGTPYRILMGSEFSKEDVICFCQFSDIVRAKEDWDAEHLSDDSVEEWDNPYYGFPQLVRFGFTPSKTARQILEERRLNGLSSGLNELFRPVSIEKQTDGSHKSFVHKDEVLELFRAIDGSEESDGIFPFLDYDKIQDGSMCRHMVCVLPYCAACDALEELLTNNRERFRHLGDYQIINISGVDSARNYRTVSDIKAVIDGFEAEGCKTITLTVNRMLTGSTVKQWDTMLFLRDTASPQEYDQAVFRLQNQYVTTSLSADGDRIRLNLKPQTLLVDFNPNRMFMMQEQKSLIYNVNTDQQGNKRLKERLDEELSISPIIVVENSKIHRVESTDILHFVSEYSRNRGVREEAQSLPIDAHLLAYETIKEEIEKQPEIGSRAGLTFEANTGEEYDLGEDEHQGGTGNQPDGDDNTRNEEGDPNSDDIRTIEKKFKTYYSRILFFGFLTDYEVSSLSDIIALSALENEGRILKNLGLRIRVLELMQTNMNPFVLSQLDYKIQNLNSLSRDASKAPIERAATAMAKFGRLSDSEVTTPLFLAEEMISTIPDQAFKALLESNRYCLDIASKMGEFAIAICERCINLGINPADIPNSLQAITTSSIAYEFTRKVYRFLGLSVNSVAQKVSSYDLIDEDDRETTGLYGYISRLFTDDGYPIGDDITPSDESVGPGDTHHYAIVVGNPPYQELDGGAGVSARAIYPQFVSIAKGLYPDYVAMIIPSRWYSAGKNLTAFRSSMLTDKHISELHDYLHPEELFPDTNNRGGVCSFLWSAAYDSSVLGTRVVTHGAKNTTSETMRQLDGGGFGIFVRDSKALGVIAKVMKKHKPNEMLSSHISSAKAFGLRTFFVDDPRFRPSDAGLKRPVVCYGKRGKIGYVEQGEILSHAEWIPLWKVFMPESNNIGTELEDDNQNAFVGRPQSVCTETFLVVGADLNLNEAAANNLCGYLKTKFARFLLGIAKTSQHGTKNYYRFVPVVDLARAWTDSDLFDYYGLSDEEKEHIESSIKSMT